MIIPKLNTDNFCLQKYGTIPILEMKLKKQLRYIHSGIEDEIAKNWIEDQTKGNI